MGKVVSSKFNELIRKYETFSVNILQTVGDREEMKGYFNVTIQIDGDKIIIPPFGVINLGEWEFDFNEHATHLVSLSPKGRGLPEIQIHK